MSERLAGKRVCVTSAGGAVGAVLARAAMEEGASVLVADANLGRAVSTAEAIGKAVEAVQLDMRSLSSRSDFIDRVGERGVDVLINHASVIDVRPFLELSERDLEETFDINVKAMTLTLLAVANHMVSRSIRGSIINRLGQLGSTTTHRGSPSTAPFNASNAAVESITNSAALALATHGIRVNCVAPGPMQMPMWEALDEAFAGVERGVKGERIASVTASIPLKRFGEATDLIGAVLFLASDESQFVTGETINVDGGFSLV